MTASVRAGADVWRCLALHSMKVQAHVRVRESAQVPTLPVQGGSQKTRIIDLHQDMLSGVARLDRRLPGLRFELPHRAVSHARRSGRRCIRTIPRLRFSASSRPTTNCSAFTRLVATPGHDRRGSEGRGSANGCLAPFGGASAYRVSNPRRSIGCGPTLAAQPGADVELRDRLRLQLLRRPCRPPQAGRPTARPHARARARFCSIWRTSTRAGSTTRSTSTRRPCS